MLPHEQFIISCYWSITTLSVVGYGDLFPKNTVEMLLGTFILLGGVAFFSFIMSSVVDMIESTSTNVETAFSKEALNQWILSLQRWYYYKFPVPKAMHD